MLRYSSTGLKIHSPGVDPLIAETAGTQELTRPPGVDRPEKQREFKARPVWMGCAANAALLNNLFQKR